VVLNYELAGQKEDYVVPTTMNVFTNYYFEQRFNEAQGKYVVRLFINDIVVKTAVNSMAYEFENIKVYTSDEYYPTCNVIIKDLKFGTFDCKNRRMIV